MSGEITPFREPIEGEWVVVTPPEPLDWSFWRDDVPNLLRLAAALAVGLYLYDFVYRTLS